ncbi:MAG TPA: hypothetical protein VK154_09410 [Chitinophagales bacterium]|nr:hypothetical protein [Chitinophagales bacterium]
MEPVNTEHTLEKLHNEWLGTLLAYEQHLNSTEAVTNQLQSSVNDMQFQRELQQLRTEIVNQKNTITALSSDIMQLRNRFSARDEKKVISMADLIENNRFRDKVRKSEQNIFMLKYQASKLLSIAS